MSEEVSKSIIKMDWNSHLFHCFASGWPGHLHPCVPRPDLGHGDFLREERLGVRLGHNSQRGLNIRHTPRGRFLSLLRKWTLIIDNLRWVSRWWPRLSAQWPWAPGRTARSAPGVRRARTRVRWAGRGREVMIIWDNQGDSGGPLTYESGDQHILIGDVSFGQGCAEVIIWSENHTWMFGL